MLRREAVSNREDNAMEGAARDARQERKDSTTEVSKNDKNGNLQMEN